MRIPMPVIDEELVHRTIRWCSDAGRIVTAEQVRAALEPLSWDELVAAKARLADAPPARPLGPRALADLARGALPDVAAEHEREGRYLPEPVPQGEPRAAEPPPLAPAPPRPRAAASRRKRARGAAAPIIHRARDRSAASPRPARALPLVDELFASEGRAVLQRLLRGHGARRAPMVAALRAGWRRADGSPPGDEELAQLLDAHGLSRAFERRERDELLHALRATGGVFALAAERVGLSPEAFSAAIERLRAGPEAESIRAVHRDELRRRGTLSERVRMLLSDPGRLGDLGILREIEDDLRQRLPEHVRALRASGAAPLGAALARSLAIGPRDVATVVSRLGIEIDAPVRAPVTASSRRSPPPPHPRGRARGRPSPARGPKRR